VELEHGAMIADARPSTSVVLPLRPATPARVGCPAQPSTLRPSRRAENRRRTLGRSERLLLSPCGADAPCL
jgi:hypothetical protein